MSRPALSLVIPAYNEERRLPAVCWTSKRFSVGFRQSRSRFSPSVKNPLIERSKWPAPVWRAIQKFTVIDNLVHRGKGFAVRTGMLRARGEIVFFMDADLSTPLSEILKFLAYFGEHPEAAVVIGSRRDPESSIVKRQNLFRQQLGRAFNYFVKIFGVAGIKDTQCGFKAFRADACTQIFSRATIDGFAFDVEALALAQAMGYRVDVRPVVWVNSADSKVRVLIDPLKMLWDLIRIKRRVRRALRLKPFARP